MHRFDRVHSEDGRCHSDCVNMDDHSRESRRRSVGRLVDSVLRFWSERRVVRRRRDIYGRWNLHRMSLRTSEEENEKVSLRLQWTASRNTWITSRDSVRRRVVADCLRFSASSSVSLLRTWSILFVNLCRNTSLTDNIYISKNTLIDPDIKERFSVLH